MTKLLEFLRDNVMELFITIIVFVVTVKGIIDGISGIKKKSFPKKK